MPTDPKELMLLAAKVNGLTGDDVKPWHLKATYKTFDEQGNVKDQGIYEEFWVSSKEFKRTFTGAAFTQTEFGTEKGIMVFGKQIPLPNPITQLRNEFVGSMMSPEAIQGTNFELKQREVGNIKFDCLNPITSAGILYGTISCLDIGKSILRLSASQGGTQSIHNGIVKFQNRYIAEDLRLIQQSRLVLTSHIDTIEGLKTTDDTLFQPPTDATAKRISITVAGGVSAGMLLKNVPPDYPLYAIVEGIQGTVVLQATISKEGRIIDLHVISGPSELQQASMDAVKQWKYRPYLLNDEPVEVQTIVNVLFTLGGARP